LLIYIFRKFVVTIDTSKRFIDSENCHQVTVAVDGKMKQTYHQANSKMFECASVVGGQNLCIPIEKGVATKTVL